MIKSRLILFSALMVFGLNSWAQEGCATDEIHNQRMLTDQKYSHQLEVLESEIATIIENQAYYKGGPPGGGSTGGTDDSTVYTIPVVVHVIHLGEEVGTGSNISDSIVFDAIAGMNARYSNVSGTGVDTKMQFCLAARDPQGNPSNGISRVDGSGVANYAVDGISIGSGYCGADINTIKDLSKWPVSDYYNVWVVHNICTYGINAFSQFPNGSAYDGVVMEKVVMSSVYATLAHEVAHGFYLYHTFQGDGDGSSCPVDRKCGTTDGDRVCDTPPHKRGDCETNSCTSAGIWDNSRYNFMSYCPNVTRDRFTQGQKDRMRATCKVFPRLSLLTSLGCTPSGYKSAFTSIENETTGNIVALYPNPAKDMLNIELNNKAGKEVKIVLYNTLGEVAYQTAGSNERFSLDISDRPAGMYFISVMMDGQVTSQQYFVVAK